MEPLEFRSEKEASGALVYTLGGNLFGSPEGYAFQDDVRGAVAEGPRGIVVDVSAVQRLDSSGVGILLTIMWSASQAGTKLILAALPERIEKILSVAVALEHIEHAPTLNEALARL
ncbi:MAG: STAS domain-containing protein [Acidobacteria bacterium]|nr:STAS domain-containing protein [Acidobacteriota bacterium]NIM63300.1 STAS domain-containing protein [Acidobacteriota bacterium]NIO59147.1 STAS domain-containing protein [Acidobacteriota bacterium]NIQ30179.1 STAS domain-containing protein [Acidobacteriota bacterium]NIQ85047.1 STAS domain-containing protein [Acidobacteriota bacterium]